MRYLCLICFLVSLVVARVSAFQQANSFKPGFGAIQGKIVDEEGRPVQAAQVSVAPRDGRQMTGAGQNATSNANGEFVLSEVPKGDQIVLAAKAGAGYPDMTWKAFTSGVNSFSPVLVEEGKSTKDVILRLKKGGTLKGTVVDSGNGKALPGAWLRIERADDPALFITTRADIHGKFSFDLPSRPFNVSVSLSGYNVSVNGESLPHPQGRPIVLAPGAQQDVIVTLKKVQGD